LGGNKVRRTVWKWFWAWSYDKEEKWLNDMSAIGLQLSGVGYCKRSYYTSEAFLPVMISTHYIAKLRIITNICDLRLRVSTESGYAYTLTP